MVPTFVASLSLSFHLSSFLSLLVHCWRGIGVGKKALHWRFFASRICTSLLHI